MGQLDIARLYRFLIEYQELDPEIARRILQEILDILRDMQRERVRRYTNTKEESVDKDR